MADSPAPRVPPAWTVAQASLAFILDVESLDRTERQADLVDSLIFAAVVAANMAPVNADPNLQHAHAGVGAPAPVPVRRPVTVNAVAQSLRLPFETVRRRIGAMAAKAALSLTPQGVLAPDHMLSDPGFIAALVGRHARLRAFYADVKAAGGLPDEPGAAPGKPRRRKPPPPPPAREPPVRLANRVMWEYVLRVGDELNPMTGGVVQTMILLTLADANIGQLAPEQLAAWAADPERLAHPVRASRLAQVLGLPAETTRRYALGLEAAGFFRRTPRGLIVVAPPERRAELLRLLEINLANVQRLFGRLRQLDALRAWDIPERAAG
jgi:hypothetical protein